MDDVAKPAPMTILQQLIEVCRNTPDRLLSANEIKARVTERFGTNPTSIIPSDHCYNRLNHGIKIRTPIFVRVGTSEYRYIGPAQPYTGLVFGRPRGATDDRIVGEWVDGNLSLFDTTRNVPDKPMVDVTSCQPTTILDPTLAFDAISASNQIVQVADSASQIEALPLSQKQLDRLFEEYMEILTLEVAEFGCQPTETRHLIGRLGEFYCARLTRGQLARRVNQEGFDVISGTGKRISVKATAQQRGFVSINANTIERADELMVIQYVGRDFKVLYHGDILAAIKVSRLWQGRYEFDVTKARKLASTNQGRV